jgi:hypothetical protein
VGGSLLPCTRRYNCHRVPTAPLSEAAPEVVGPKPRVPPPLSERARLLCPAFIGEPHAAAIPELPAFRRRSNNACPKPSVPALRSPSSAASGHTSRRLLFVDSLKCRRLPAQGHRLPPRSTPKPPACSRHPLRAPVRTLSA